MKGYITTRQEFLFPDSPLGEMADKVHLAMAANGRMGIQLLVAAGESIRVSAPEDRKPAAHDALIARVFTSFRDYNDDPDLLEQVHEELLRLVSR